MKKFTVYHCGDEIDVAEPAIIKPEPGEIERIIAEPVRCEPIRYPEEVRHDAMIAQLRRQIRQAQEKGKVYGHFT